MERLEMCEKARRAAREAIELVVSLNDSRYKELCEKEQDNAVTALAIEFVENALFELQDEQLANMETRRKLKGEV